nr:thioesterase family protein [Kibdelosporangium sp. MJ126-NF4]CEL19842.1 TesB-like acyl-CoA thioesterase 5 [Kibdelosporangium sp. MJ126-NF4]CTQ97066.1 TesB-like acyl-CoA thioesterase 5 [Kibdelosporangium sp. MJ126-NF4]
MAEAFYRSLGDGRYDSGPATAGPWSPKTQHAGPPSALLGRALQSFGGRTDLRVARVTVEIPKPVPVGEVQVEVRALRSGARTDLLDAQLLADGEPVMLARAWRMSPSPDGTPELRAEPPPPALPGPQPPHGMSGAYVDGYLSAIEWRFLDGGGFDSRGPGAAWARQRIPLVDGEEDTPLSRVLTVADASWAVGFELDLTRQFAINTDVTVALHRQPVGEWFCMRTATTASPDGSGLAVGQLSDAHGDCGRIIQTLFIADR